MLVKDVMNAPPMTVSPAIAADGAARLMLQANVSGLPVVDDRGNLVGILTEGDFLRRAETGTERKRPRWLEFFTDKRTLANEYLRAHGQTVSDLMTKTVVTVDEDAELSKAVDLMEQNHVKRLPVRRNGTLVGMLSRNDLLRAMSKLVPSAPPAKGAGADADIRNAILREMKSQAWAPTSSIDIQVRDGHVTMNGVTFGPSHRRALHVLVQSIAGVRSVRDHVLWIDAPPLPGI